MKKVCLCLSLILFCGVLASEASVASVGTPGTETPQSVSDSQTLTHTLHQSVSDIRWVQTADGYTRIQYSDAADQTMGEPGEPELPATTVLFAIPEGFRVVDVSVTASWQALAQEVRMYPVQAPTRGTEQPTFTPPNAEVYGQAVYPAQSFIRQSVARASGVSIQPVTLIPFRYAPGVNMLEAASEMQVVVKLEATTGASTRSTRALTNYSAALRQRVASTVVNPEVVSTDMGLSVRAANNHPDYVIISPTDLLPAWQEYAQARQAAHPELIFTVKDTGDIYNRYKTYPGTSIAYRNNAEKIWGYIKEMGELGTTYFVLGGPFLKEGETVYNATETPLSTANAIPGVYGSPCGTSMPSDYFYACLDTVDPINHPYPWDYDGDGTYCSAGESKDTVDIVADVVVTRMTMTPFDYGTGAGVMSATRLIQAYTAKLARGETLSYPGRFKYGIAGETSDYVAYQSGTHNSTRRNELEFYDNGYNMFDPRHNSTFIDVEVGIRTRPANVLCQWRPMVESSLMIRGSVWTKGYADADVARTAFWNADFEFANVDSHGWALGAAGFNAADVRKNTGLVKIFSACQPCQTGWMDFTQDYTYNLGWFRTETRKRSTPCLGESYVNNPVGGALVSFNNTRDGWFTSSMLPDDGMNSRISTYIHDFLFKENCTSGLAWLNGLAQYATRDIAQMASSRRVDCLIETMHFGDPLVVVTPVSNIEWTGAANNNTWSMSAANWRSATNDTANVAYEYADDTRFNVGAGKTISLADHVSTRSLTINQPVGSTFTLNGNGDVKIMNRLSVTNGNITLNVPGGVGHEGVVFEGEKGILTLGATRASGTTYIAAVSNASEVVMRGANAVLDLQTTAKPSMDRITVVGTSKNVNTNNIIRSRTAGAFATFPTIPVENAELVFETVNAGGNGVRTSPWVAVTNGTVTIAKNPMWQWERLTRPIILDNGTLHVTSPYVGFGNTSSGGFDVYASGASAITANDATIEMMGETRLHVAADATLTLSAPMTLATGANGVMRKMGDGTAVLSLINAASGMVLVESGTLVLQEIPLTGVTNLTVRAGAKLVLPHTNESFYQILKAGGTVLNFEQNSEIYDSSDLTTPLAGATTPSGKYIVINGLRTWVGDANGNGTWSLDAAQMPWRDTGGTAVAFATDSAVQFQDLTSRAAEITVNGNLSTSISDFSNTSTAYTFEQGSNGALTFARLLTTGRTTFNLPVKVISDVVVSGGELNMSTVDVPSVTVGDGGTFGANCVTNDVGTRMIYAVRFAPLAIAGTENQGPATAELRLFRGNSQVSWSGATAVSSTPDNSGHGAGNLIDGTLASNSNKNKWWLNGSMATSAELAKTNCYATITFASPITMFDSYGVQAPDVTGGAAGRGVTAWALFVSYDGVTFDLVDVQRDVANASDYAWLGVSGASASRPGFTLPPRAADFATIQVQEGGTLLARGMQSATITFDAGATFRSVPGEYMTHTRPAGVVFPKEGLVCVDAADVTNMTNIVAVRFAPLAISGTSNQGPATSEFRIFKNGVQIPWTGATAVSSTSDNATHGVTCLIDGTLSPNGDLNKWWPNGAVATASVLAATNCYATITFAEPIAMFDSYGVLAPDVTGGAVGRGVTAWVVQVSVDGEHFITVDAQSNIANATDNTWLGASGASATRPGFTLDPSSFTLPPSSGSMVLLKGLGLTEKDLYRFQCISPGVVLRIMNGNLCAISSDGLEAPYARQISGNAVWNTSTVGDWKANGVAFTQTWANSVVDQTAETSITVDGGAALTVDVPVRIGHFKLLGGGNASIGTSGSGSLSAQVYDFSAYGGNADVTFAINEGTLIPGTNVTQVVGGSGVLKFMNYGCVALTQPWTGAVEFSQGENEIIYRGTQTRGIFNGKDATIATSMSLGDLTWQGNELTVVAGATVTAGALKSITQNRKITVDGGTFTIDSWAADADNNNTTMRISNGGQLICAGDFKASHYISYAQPTYTVTGADSRLKVNRITISTWGGLTPQNMTIEDGGTLSIGAGGITRHNHGGAATGYNLYVNNGTIAAHDDWSVIDEGLTYPATCTIFITRGSSARLDPTSHTLTYNRTIADASSGIDGRGGELIVGGMSSASGRVVLTKTNTYTGGTVVSNTTLVVEHPRALGTGPLTLEAGASVELGTNRVANVLQATSHGTLHVSITDVSAPTRLISVADDFVYPSAGFTVMIHNAAGNTLPGTLRRATDALVYVPAGYVESNSPSRATLTGSSTWTAAPWQDANGQAITSTDAWLFPLETPVTVASDVAATLDVDRVVKLATLNIVNTAPLTLTATNGSLQCTTLDLSGSSARTTIACNTSAETIKAGADTHLSVACDTSLQVDAGKSATLKAPLTGDATVAGTLTIPGEKIYRYVRWQITASRAANAGIQLSEFALYDANGDRISLTDAAVLRSGSHSANIPNAQFTKGEKIANLFDTSTASKWFFSSNDNCSFPVNFVIDLGENAVPLSGYAIAAANDVPDRDPVQWTLAGSVDGETWTTLHTMSGFAAIDRFAWSSKWMFEAQGVQTAVTGATRVTAGGVLACNGTPSFIGSISLAHATLQLAPDTVVTLPAGTTLSAEEATIDLSACTFEEGTYPIIVADTTQGVWPSPDAFTLVPQRTDTELVRTVTGYSIVRVGENVSPLHAEVTTDTSDWSQLSWYGANGRAVTETFDWSVASNHMAVVSNTLACTLTLDAPLTLDTLRFTTDFPVAITGVVPQCVTIDASNASTSTLFSISTGAASIIAGNDTILTQSASGSLTIAADKKATLRDIAMGSYDNNGVLVLDMSTGKTNGYKATGNGTIVKTGAAQWNITEPITRWSNAITVEQGVLRNQHNGGTGHDGNATMTFTKAVAIAEGATFIDISDYKYQLHLTGGLSGAGTYRYKIPTVVGQTDGYRGGAIRGAGDFTGTLELEGTTGATEGACYKVNMMLNPSSDSFGRVKFIGVNHATSGSTDNATAAPSFATLTLGKSLTLAGLEGRAGIVTAASAQTLALNDTTDATFGGTIKTNVTLVKTGSATWTFNGIAEALTVSAGTLAGLPTSLGTLTMAGGTTLSVPQGTFTVDTLIVPAGETVTVDLGSRVLPGGETTLVAWTTRPAGTLTVSGNLEDTTISVTDSGLIATKITIADAVSATITTAASEWENLPWTPEVKTNAWRGAMQTDVVITNVSCASIVTVASAIDVRSLTVVASADWTLRAEAFLAQWMDLSNTEQTTLDFPLTADTRVGADTRIMQGGSGALTIDTDKHACLCSPDVGTNRWTGVVTLSENGALTFQPRTALLSPLTVPAGARLSACGALLDALTLDDGAILTISDAGVITAQTVVMTNGTARIEIDESLLSETPRPVLAVATGMLSTDSFAIADAETVLTLSADKRTLLIGKKVYDPGTPKHGYAFNGNYASMGTTALTISGEAPSTAFERSINGQAFVSANGSAHPYGSGVQYGAGAYTISTVIQSVDNLNALLFALGTKDGNPGLTLISAGTNQVAVAKHLGNAAHTKLVVADVPNAATQYHLYTIVCDRTNLTFYVDGNACGSAPFSVPANNNFQWAGLHGGQGNQGYVRVSGVKIDDWRLYQRALSTNEIAFLARGLPRAMPLFEKTISGDTTWGAAETWTPSFVDSDESVASVTVAQPATFDIDARHTVAMLKFSGNKNVQVTNQGAYDCAGIAAYDFSALSATSTVTYATGAAAVQAGSYTILTHGGLGELSIGAGKAASLNETWLGAISINGGNLAFTGTHNYTRALTFNNGSRGNFDADMTIDNTLNLDTSTITISGGTLRPKHVRTNNQPGNQTVIINHTGGMLDMTAFGTEPANNSESTIAYGSRAGTMLIGHWSGTATYNLSGGTLQAENRYIELGYNTGSAVLKQTGGTLKVKALVGTAAGAYTLSGGTLELKERIDLPGANKIQLGDGIVKATGAFRFVQPVTLIGAGPVLDARDTALSLSNAFAGVGGLRIMGTVALAATNTFTGGLIVTNGTLSVADVAALGVGDVTVTRGATLTLTNQIETNVYTIATGSFTWEGDVRVNDLLLDPAEWMVTGGVITKQTVQVESDPGTVMPEEDATFIRTHFPTDAGLPQDVVVVAESVALDGTPLSVENNNAAAAVANILNIVPVYTAEEGKTVARVKYCFAISSLRVESGVVTLQAQVRVDAGVRGATVNGVLRARDASGNTVLDGSTTTTSPAYDENGLITLPPFTTTTGTFIRIEATR